MKPLTIEQLKSLEVGDWVWVVSPMYMRGRYLQVHYNGVNTIQWYGIPNDTLYMYDDYGTKWLAYKNKEQAECKGEIVELPCIEPFSTFNIVTGEPSTAYNILYRDMESGELVIDCEIEQAEAERRLAELRGEKK